MMMQKPPDIPGIMDYYDLLMCNSAMTEHYGRLHYLNQMLIDDYNKVINGLWDKDKEKAQRITLIRDDLVHRQRLLNEWCEKSEAMCQHFCATMEANVKREVQRSEKDVIMEAMTAFQEKYGDLLTTTEDNNVDHDH